MDPGWVGDASILVVSVCLFFQTLVFFFFFFFDDPHVVKGKCKKHTPYIALFQNAFASLIHSIVSDSNKPTIRDSINPSAAHLFQSPL